MCRNMMRSIVKQIRPIVITILIVGLVIPSMTTSLFAKAQAYPARTTYFSKKLCDTFGFGNHADRPGGPMTNTTKKIQYYKDLCTHHIRDAVPEPGSAAATELHKLADEGFTLFFQLKKTTDTRAEVRAAVATLCDYVPELIAVSPPNEMDAEGAGWVAKYRQMQQWLYEEVRAVSCLQNVKVLSGATRSGVDVSQIGDISKWADAANAHGYSKGWTPEYALHLYYGRYSSIIGNKPRWMTEIGFAANDTCKNGSTVWSEKASTIYSVRSLFASLQAGYQKTYWYKIVDEDTADSPDWLAPNQQCFGLLRSDWTPKPQYTAMKNTMTIMKQATPNFTLQKLRMGITTVSGKKTQTMVFQKAPGKWLVVNWQANGIYDTTTKQDINPADGVVKFRFPWGVNIKVYQPEQGTNPLASYTSKRMLRYKSNEHARIFEITKR